MAKNTNGRLPPKLVEKAGISLVGFHLASRGFEFQPTSTGSHVGDLWVETATGILPLEVKASSGSAWHIRLDQIGRVALFAFVSLRNASCWVATAEQVAAMVPACSPRAANIVVATTANMPQGSAGNWRILGEALTLPPKDVLPGRFRVVSKRLADGSIKRYKYPLKATNNRRTTDQTEPQIR